MTRLLVVACLVITAPGCAASINATTTSVVDVFGLECRTDRIESVVNDYGAVAGSDSAEEALVMFFDGEGRRFSSLERSGVAADDLSYAFVDADGLTQLIVQLTDEYDGYLVAGYSNCADGS